MSRTIPLHPRSHLTYEAADQFKRLALLGGQSLLLPDEKTLWTPENFERNGPASTVFRN